MTRSGRYFTLKLEFLPVDWMIFSALKMILNQSYDGLAKSKSRHDNNMLIVSLISFLPYKKEANYLNMFFHLSFLTHLFYSILFSPLILQLIQIQIQIQIQFQYSPFSNRGRGQHKVILMWWHAKVGLASICHMAFHV